MKEIPKRRVKCSECTQTFTRNEHLRDHIVAKHTYLMYECELCDKTYKYPNSLRAHIKTALGRNVLKRKLLKTPEDAKHQKFAKSQQVA